MLHEVLTGRRLFKGQNDVLTIERVRRCEVPPPSLQNPMVPPELDAIVLKALARNRDDRLGDGRRHGRRARRRRARGALPAGAPRAAAARPVPGRRRRAVHAVPPERRPPTHTTNPSNVTGSGVPSAVRSPTIQPITRSSSRGAPFDNPAAADLLRPKRSRLAIVAGAVAVLGVGGFFVWKGTSAHGGNDPAVHAPVPNDPARRFHIYVKSEPPGADIFLDGKTKPVGATPISLPIDLNGVSSVQLLLKKPGYEDYQQIITTDSAISINLQPLEADKKVIPVEAEPPAAAAAPEEAAHSEESGDSQAKAKRHGKEAPKRSNGRKGEIVDPF